MQARDPGTREHLRDVLGGIGYWSFIVLISKAKLEIKLSSGKMNGPHCLGFVSPVPSKMLALLMNDSDNETE